MADTELQQLIIYVGTEEQIAAAMEAGTITENDLSITTDSPEYQTLLTAANAGTGISITNENGVVKINNTQTSAEWGNITGTLSNQTDLSQALASKLTTSDILNVLNSTAIDKALSANMGKELQEEIDNLKARGRFLALWNCATGLAQTNPPDNTYEYKAGDYFIVGTVAQSGGTNYKPTGSSYTIGVASTVVETQVVDVDDVYYYDGTSWALQINTQKTVSFFNLAGSPYDNTNLATALNGKQPTGNYVTQDTAQDVTSTKTFKTQQRIQSGQADGCLIVGADVSSTTLTNGTRKLGRLGFPTNEDITLICAFVSCDTQSAAGSGIENSVDFGGRVGDTTSTSPDALTFTVAKEHNSTNNTKKLSVLRMTKDGADFLVKPTHNGVGFCSDTNGEVKGSAWNGQLTVLRTTSGGSFITFKNTVSNVKTTLGAIGLGAPNAIPTWIDATNTNTNVLVRGGSFATPAVGNATTPVYIDSDGIAQPCSQSIAPAIVTLTSGTTVTLANNTMYQGGELSSFGITTPTGSYPFACEIDFASGNSPTTITYTGTIKWVEGSDDITQNVFVPVANKSYTVITWWNNNSWVGSVKGV